MPANSRWDLIRRLRVKGLMLKPIFSFPPEHAWVQSYLKIGRVLYFKVFASPCQRGVPNCVFFRLERKTAQTLMLTAICRRQVLSVFGAAEFTLVPLRTELPHFLIRQKYDYLESSFEYNSLACVFSKHKTGRTISVQALKVPGVQALRFQENRHTKWVRLSVLRTGRPYPQEIFLVLISVRSWVNPRAIVQPEGLCQ